MEHLQKIIQIFFSFKGRNTKRGYKISINLVFVFYKNTWTHGPASIQLVATQLCKAQKALKGGLFLEV